MRSLTSPGRSREPRGSVFEVEKEDGQVAQITFPEEPQKLRFMAKALPAYLRPGMPVRFRTTLGPAGQPMTPVDKVELFTPVDMKRLRGRAIIEYRPGVNPADGQPPKPPLTGPVVVVGQLAGLTPEGLLSVRAGQIPVQVQLDPAATFQILANDLSLAQPGDSVKVLGFFEPSNELLIRGDEITIKVDRIYGEEPPATERPARRTRRSRRDAMTKPDPETTEAPAEVPIEESELE